MDNFDLKKFLVENKLTNQSRKLDEDNPQGAYSHEELLALAKKHARKLYLEDYVLTEKGSVEFRNGKLIYALTIPGYEPADEFTSPQGFTARELEKDFQRIGDTQANAQQYGYGGEIQVQVVTWGRDYLPNMNEDSKSIISNFQEFLSTDGRTIDLRYENGWSAEVRQLNRNLLQFKTDEPTETNLNRYGTLTQVTYPVNINGNDYQVVYKIDSSG